MQSAVWGPMEGADTLMDGGPEGKGSWVRKMNRHVDAEGEGPSEWREGSEWPMCVRGVA